MTEKLCPKCRKPYLIYSYFADVDHTGIIGCVCHSKKIVTDPMGGKHEQYDDRCFLTIDEFKKLPLQKWILEDMKRFEK